MTDSTDSIGRAFPASLDRSVRMWSVYRTCAVIGLGGLFAGITGPLISTFVPPHVLCMAPGGATGESGPA